MIQFTVAALLIMQTLAAPSARSGAPEGRILSAEGQPAAAIRVFAIPADAGVARKTDLRIAAITQTDEAGHFRLDGLAPGRYYIAAGPLNAWTLYPGVTELSGAIAVSSGDPLPLEFHLDRSTTDMFYEISHVPEQIEPLVPGGKAVTAQTNLEPGQMLLVEDGDEWWGARILTLMPDGSVRVHLLGADPAADQTVPRSRLQLEDAVIEKMWVAQWKRGFPMPEETDRGIVPTAPGPIESTGNPVTAQTRLAPKQVLQVEEGRLWWAATIVDVLADERVRIHYLGWGSRSDEIVPRSRLQLDENAVDKAQRAMPDSPGIRSLDEHLPINGNPDGEPPLMKPFATIPVEDGLEPWQIRFTPDGQRARIFSTGIVTYDLNTGAVLSTIPLLEGERVLTTSADGSTAILSAEGKATLLHVETGERELLPEDWQAPADQDTTISGDGGLLGIVSIGEGSERMIVDVYDLKSRVHITRRSHGLFAGGIMDARITEDGRFVAFENNRSGADLVYAGTGRPGPEFPGPNEGFQTARSPDGAWAIQIPYPGYVDQTSTDFIVRDGITGQLRGALAVHQDEEDAWTHVSFCGNRVALSRSREVTVHDLPSGKTVGRYLLNPNARNAQSAAADGPAPMVICAGDVTGAVWDSRLILMRIPYAASSSGQASR
ncbi:MAG TPA: hypothetical protein VFY29_10430 [Terriglobia bacterium]|nr:hypothetical protein [Terriglobia bacterium]